MPYFLHPFIIRAKKATYVGGGAGGLVFAEGEYTYRDTYVGGTDFIGQECVWRNGVAVWSMAYYGYILRPDLITGPKVASILRKALSQPHAQGRLLDNFTFENYAISSQGTVEHFSGRETITVHGTLAYALDYLGGLVKS
jgi:Domain of unknown function (DUF5680)